VNARTDPPARPLRTSRAPRDVRRRGRDPAPDPPRLGGRDPRPGGRALPRLARVAVLRGRQRPRVGPAPPRGRPRRGGPRRARPGAVLRRPGAVARPGRRGPPNGAPGDRLGRRRVGRPGRPLGALRPVPLRAPDGPARRPGARPQSRRPGGVPPRAPPRRAVPPRGHARRPRVLARARPRDPGLDRPGRGRPRGRRARRGRRGAGAAAVRGLVRSPGV
ncbi:MAG: hypothetical protein AVDCRST_MAG13-3641, partial [uncultured Solirubrobacteraceae bacterium]